MAYSLAHRGFAALAVVPLCALGATGPSRGRRAAAVRRRPGLPRRPRARRGRAPGAWAHCLGAPAQVFWLLAGTFAVCGASHERPGRHPLRTRRARPRHGHAAAASLLAVIGVFDLVGTVASGWFTDRFDPRRLLAVYYALRGMSLLFLPCSSRQGATADAVLHRLLRPRLGRHRASDDRAVPGALRRGRRDRLRLGARLAPDRRRPSSPSSAGLVRDTTGTYDIAWTASGALCAMAALMALVIRAEETRREVTPRHTTGADGALVKPFRAERRTGRTRTGGSAERGAVRARRDAERRLQVLPQRRARTEARLRRDAVDRQVGLLQQLPRPVDALPGQPLHRRQAGLLAEAPRERPYAHGLLLRQLPQRQRPVQMPQRPSAGGAGGGAPPPPRTGRRMNCAWPPSRCGGTTVARATSLATAAPWSRRISAGTGRSRPPRRRR